MLDVKRYTNLPYEQGLNDCYTRVQDFFLWEFGVELTNYARPDNWAYVGFDFFTEFFQKEGFSEVNIRPNNVRFGDLLLMNLQRSPVPNHIAIYLGQGQILHHLRDRLSEVEPYSVRWQSRVQRIIRHPVIESQTQLEGLSSLVEMLPAHIKNRLKKGT